MTHVDPFAPADDPRHPSQQQAPAGLDDMSAVLAQEAADLDAYEELAGTHLTPSEAELRATALAGGGVPDGSPALPSLGDLQARVDALVDYLERREQGDTEPPRIVDAFGVEHVLTVSDDASDAAWQPAERTYQDMKVPELQALLRERELPVTGNKPELIERLAEDDERRSQAAASTEGDEALAQKLAALDEVKGGGQ